MKREIIEYLGCKIELFENDELPDGFLFAEKDGLITACLDLHTGEVTKVIDDGSFLSDIREANK